MLPQRKGDVLADRHAVEQRRVLKQKAEPDPLLHQLACLAGSHRLLAVENHFAARRMDQTDERFQQHRLAAAAFADDRQRLSARHAEVDVAQHVLSAECHVEMPDVEQRRIVQVRTVGGRCQLARVSVTSSCCMLASSSCHGHGQLPFGYRQIRFRSRRIQVVVGRIHDLPRNRSMARMRTNDQTKALRRGAADAFGAGRAMKAAIAAHQGDRRRRKTRF